MYYPEEVIEELGPTEILPCTQYWMNDNSPEPRYPTGGRTVGQGLMHIDDIDERDAARGTVLEELGWPAETNPVRLVVPAGSIGITHFDVFHRGTRRMLGTGADKRIMIKLWYYRMHDNATPSWDHVPSDDDVAPASFRTDAGIRGEQEPIWTRMWHWMLGNGKSFHADAPIRRCDSATLSQLSEKLNAAAGGKDAARIEPSRVGAAYALALDGSAEAAQVLESAFVKGADASLGLEVDGVERSAAYGLAALPAFGGVPALVRVATDCAAAAAEAMAASGVLERPLNNKRALALHALGQCADTADTASLHLLGEAVGDTSSVFVQSTAALALGYIGRRAGAEGNLAAVAAILAILLPPLDMDLAGIPSNGLMAPYVDLAEGINGPEDPTTVDASHPAATAELIAGVASMPRSATRELAVTSLLMTASACVRSGASGSDPASWEQAVGALASLSHADPNRFAMGFAAEGLRRLAGCSGDETQHPGKLQCAVQALERFVGCPRWKPPEMAGALGLVQEHYDFDQGLYVHA